MFCQKCGAPNDDNAFKCTSCGHILQSATLTESSRPEPGSPYVKNYLAQSILVTLFCCIPFGIVAIVYAAQVNGKLRAGDVEGARQASSAANTWCWISFGTGITILVLYMLVMIGAEL